MIGRNSVGVSENKLEEDPKDKDGQFAKDCLAIMNKYRVLHQVAPLVYNRDLERFAKEWADQLVKTNSFMHNPNPVLNGMELGENIASRWSTGHEPITAEQTINQWYNEVERYDFKTSSGPKTGHFTQVVWKGSKEVGVGKSQMKDGTWIVVAYYLPPGNYVGEYAENVLPSKDGTFGHIDSGAKATSTRTQETKPACPHGSDAKHAGTESKCATGGSTTHRQVQTEKVGNVTKTTTTETVTFSDGAVTITVTEKTQGPGLVTKTKVVKTMKKVDGSTATETTETTEHGIARGQMQRADGEIHGKSIGDLAEFRNDVVKRHNVLRRRHRDTGELVLNAELTETAQKWADHLAKTKSLIHSRCTYQGQAVGENVASRHGTGPVDYTGDEVVEQWYKEGEKYDYENPPVAQSGMECGHFTQVVWKDSTDIGIGKAFSDDNRVYVVAQYHPAGNYIGRQNYERNVRPLKFLK